MHDIRKLGKCNGPVKVLITYCKSEQPWQARSGRVNGKVQYYQPWELLLKRINSLFLLRFHSRLGEPPRLAEVLGGVDGDQPKPTVVYLQPAANSRHLKTG